METEVGRFKRCHLIGLSRSGGDILFLYVRGWHAVKKLLSTCRACQSLEMVSNADLRSPLSRFGISWLPIRESDSDNRLYKYIYNVCLDISKFSLFKFLGLKVANPLTTHSVDDWYSFHSGNFLKLLKTYKRLRNCRDINKKLWRQDITDVYKRQVSLVFNNFSKQNILLYFN